MLAGDVVIGWSELEKGDPPMGVAVGVLHPSAAYAGASPASQLRVRPEGGPFFDPVGGVQVEDYSADLGPDGLEVSVVGIEAVTYERYFPHHLKAYEEQFRR